MKNFPLPMHQFARKAAAAALAADRQGKFHEFSHKLFENYASLSDVKIQDIAKGLGLDMAKFNRAITDPSIQGIIDRDVNDGTQASVQGTPSIFINGKALKNWNPEVLQMTIESELRKKKK